MDKIFYENSKIELILKFGMRVIFENFIDIFKVDFVGFIENYVKKILNYFFVLKIKVMFYFNLKEVFEIKFRLLDILIIIDNMISNFKKADVIFLFIDLLLVLSKEI